MTKKQWNKHTSDQKAFARASGRARRNAALKRIQFKRRAAIVYLLALRGEPARGQQKVLAEKFGVTKGTISKDLAWARDVCRGFIGSGITPKVTLKGAVISVVFEWSLRRIETFYSSSISSLLDI
jgi:hypothetical protein